MNHY